MKNTLRKAHPIELQKKTSCQRSQILIGVAVFRRDLELLLFSHPVPEAILSIPPISLRQIINITQPKPK